MCDDVDDYHLDDEALDDDLCPPLHSPCVCGCKDEVPR